MRLLAHKHMGVAHNFYCTVSSTHRKRVGLLRVMAATWRDGIPPSIDTELWQPIYVQLEGEVGGGETEGRGKGWLVKSVVNDDSYHVLVTDLCSVWGERLRREDVSSRNKVGS